MYKLRKVSFIKKICLIINDLNTFSKYKELNTFFMFLVLFLSLMFFLISFVISYKFLNLFISSLIISIFTLFCPYYIVRYLSYCRKIKILKIFPNYVISLKNYTDVNNDIILAFKRANVEEPLCNYVEKFNISIEKGVKVFDAFETLKNSINIKKINQFITLLQFCNIYGGNFSDLLDKFSKMQMKINIQKEKEKQKVFSSKLVLFVLILLNIYIMFGFVLTNNDYYRIIVNTFYGNVILNMNILSYIFIFYMYTKLNNVED